MKFNSSLVTLFLIISAFLICDSFQATKKPKKNIADMTDAEIDKIAEEWDKDEEELPDDEKPFHERKNTGQNIDVQEFLKNSKNAAESVKAFNKKNKPLMIFVEIRKSLSKLEAEDASKIWSTALFNAHYEVNRYMIDDHQAIFMVNDGSKAWEIKDYLVQQKDCLQVTIDQEKYPGLHIQKSEL
ncbi:unnamed protein product [Brachionus calyciflorus]|uniref:LDLR chaperone boca n=1 Tax=Brachionus calyciflorus TaxID=104777 RepID=A0A813QUD5_9BILA|nr:unnamed protein product [Brachionus calyciflorus]